MKRIFIIILALFAIAFLTAKIALAGGALNVPDYFRQLGDAKISSPLGGQCAVWNATDAKWENETCPMSSGGSSVVYQHTNISLGNGADTTMDAVDSYSGLPTLSPGQCFRILAWGTQPTADNVWIVVYAGGVSGTQIIAGSPGGAVPWFIETKICCITASTVSMRGTLYNSAAALDGWVFSNSTFLASTTNLTIAIQDRTAPTANAAVLNGWIISELK